MKKTRLLAIVLGLALVLPGCGFTKGSDAVVTVIEATPTPTPEPTPEPTPTPAATPTPAPVMEQTPSGVNVEVKSGTYTATAAVNVRSDCNTDAAQIGSVEQGATITSTGVCENGWIRMDYQGQTGYVSGDFVTPADTAATDTAAADGAATDAAATDTAAQ